MTKERGSLMWERVVIFFKSIWQTISETFLYIGTASDLVFAVVDILALTLIFYYLLKLVRDSRAWQLLKGLLFILFFGFISNFIGLTAIGFLLSRTISLFAIAFVVLFQPELRRALETVGRAGFKVMSADGGSVSSGAFDHKIIEAVVQACGEMAEKRTGALIVIERSTPLGDLIEQENAVAVDSTISTTVLKQIFYVGSPLHDGAILIRNGRIAAARVHIPLTDVYHLRKDLGTRHRAAIGASEIGDTIAIAVSEERGVISIAIGGRLYTLDNEDALRTQLHRLLLPQKESKKRSPFRRIKKSSSRDLHGPTRRTKAFLAMASVTIAIIFWFYVQMTINPVIAETYQVPLLYTEQESLELKGLAAQYRIETIRVDLKGRQETLANLTSRDVIAYVDLSEIKEEGKHELPIYVETRGNRYTQVHNLTPATVTIVVRHNNMEGNID